MSLLSSMRRALTPKPSPPLPPATPMHIGGLQLECPVCSFDLFRHRQLLTSSGQYGPFTVVVAAIACDRCGALQLFDPGARSMPDLTIPPRRLGRRRGRPPAAWPVEGRAGSSEAPEEEAELDRTEHGDGVPEGVDVGPGLEADAPGWPAAAGGPPDLPWASTAEPWANADPLGGQTAPADEPDPAPNQLPPLQDDGPEGASRP